MDAFLAHISAEMSFAWYSMSNRLLVRFCSCPRTRATLETLELKASLPVKPASALMFRMRSARRSSSAPRSVTSLT